jgi:hypothetical protein
MLAVAFLSGPGTTAFAQATFSEASTNAQINYLQHTLAEPPAPATSHETHCMGDGTATAEYDGDGDVDLFVTRLPPNRGSRQIGILDDVTNSAGVVIDTVPISGSQGIFTLASRLRDTETT